MTSLPRPDGPLTDGNKKLFWSSFLCAEEFGSQSLLFMARLTRIIFKAVKISQLFSLPKC